MAISDWEQEIRDGATILAGDFNCSAQTTDAHKHRGNVDRLHALGAVSAYHGHSGLGHGEEDVMTLRWVGRRGIALGCHCDFVFSSAVLAPRVTAVEVGTFDDWLKEQALARTKPPDAKPGRYRPPDTLLAFLEAL